MRTILAEEQVNRREIASFWGIIRHVLSQLVQRRDLLFFLIQKEIKIKYKHAKLGFLWAFVYPLAQAVVFFVVFSLVLRIKMDHYPIFLLSGLIPWTFFAFSFGASTWCLDENANLIKKIYFPREIIPLAKVFNYLIDFIISLFILWLIMLVVGFSPAIGIVCLLYGVSVHLLFTAGMCLVAASLAAMYRDVKYVVDLLTLFWFYCSPILYPVSMIPESFRWVRPLYYLNPMTGIMEVFHSAMYTQSTPGVFVVLYSFFWALLVFAIGLRIFHHYDHLYADIL